MRVWLFSVLVPIIASFVLFRFCFGDSSSFLFKFGEKSLGDSARTYRKTHDISIIQDLVARVSGNSQAPDAVAILGLLSADLSSNTIETLIIPAFSNALNSSRRALRRQVCITIDQHYWRYSASLVPLLLSIAEDPEEDVNSAPPALRALIKIKPYSTNFSHTMVRILHRSELANSGLDQRRSVRVEAARALSAVLQSEGSGCQTLQLFLNDENNFVRFEMARCAVLSRCANSNFIPVIQGFLLSGEDLARTELINCIGNLQPRERQFDLLLKPLISDQIPVVRSVARKYYKE